MNTETKQATETRDWRDGDVFRWSYKEPADFSPYWAKSRIGIVKGGCMFDTYWLTSGNVAWTAGEAADALTLDYLGNMDGLRKVNEGELIYYADDDVVNLNHANSSKGNAYIRIGAQRSAEKMLDVARDNIDAAGRRIAALSRIIAELREVEGAISRGDSLDELHLVEVTL